MGDGSRAQGAAVACGPVTRLSAACAFGDGLARQHLRADAPATEVVQTARDLVGLHATGAPNPYLPLFTRMPGLARPVLDYEIYERRRLARIRCRGGTLFLLPVDRVPSTMYLAAKVLTPRWYEQGASLMDAMLAGRALSAAQIRAELGAGRD